MARAQVIITHIIDDQERHGATNSVTKITQCFYFNVIVSVVSHKHSEMWNYGGGGRIKTKYGKSFIVRKQQQQQKELLL